MVEAAVDHGAAASVPNASPAAKGSSIAICQGETAFKLLGPKGEETKVPVSFFRQGDAALWTSLFESPKFRTWAAQYENHETFSLKSLDVKWIHAKENGEIQSALIQPTIASGDALVQDVEPLLLRGSRHVGVLVILRCSIAVTVAAERGMPNWSRDYVLFSSVSRPAIAHPTNLEIMTGHFDENDEFISPAADEMASILNVRIHKQDLVSLTRERAMVSAPEQLHETFELYLYRQNITDAQLSLFPITTYATSASNAGTDGAKAQHLRLTSLGEAWKMTSDAKSMAAIFLLHEFRYHGLMPKYRPPRDSKQTDVVEKRKPTFVDINSLDPHVVGVNLRVKIVTPPNPENVVEVPRRDTKVKEGKLCVGDATGIINMKLEGEQLDLPGMFAAGTSLVIRNARIEVVDNRMVLCVTKWGKVEIPQTDDEREAFAFDVNLQNDKSLVEYELVPAEDDPNVRMPAAGGPRRGGGAGARGRRGRGRGRGGRGGRGRLSEV